MWMRMMSSKVFSAVVKPSLSAGRVQSVAVRIIVEREREILDFNSKSAFRITAVFTTGTGAQVKAELPARFATEAEAMEFLEKYCSAEQNLNPLSSTILQSASNFSIGKSTPVKFVSEISCSIKEMMCSFFS